MEYLKRLYRERVEAMMAALDRIPQTMLRYIRPTGGYFIGCRMADDIDPDTFYDIIADRHVAVIPGDVMSVTGHGYERDFRLNFTRPSLEEINRGIGIIGEALEQARITEPSDIENSCRSGREPVLAGAR